MDGKGGKAHSALKPLPYHLYAFTWMNLHLSMRLKFDAISKHSLTVRVQSPMLSPFAIWSPSANTQTMLTAWLPSRMLLGLSVECDLSMSRVTKTWRQTSTRFCLQHSSIRSVITMLLGIWTTIETVNGQHKVNHSQQGTCQCKCFMVTRLSPPTMSVEYVQKLALILTVIIFKPSITGVTNSGATLPGTHLKW